MYVSIVTGIDILVSIAYFIFTKSSSHGIFTILNFLQVLMLLLFFEVELPDNVLTFIRSLNEFLLHTGSNAMQSMYISYPKCDVYDRKLTLCSIIDHLGYESRSTVNNTISAIFILTAMLTFHGVVALIYFKRKFDMRKVKLDFVNIFRIQG